MLWKIICSFNLHRATEHHRDDMKAVTEHKDFPRKDNYDSTNRGHLKSLHNICLVLINKKVAGAKDSELEAQRKMSAAHRKKARLQRR